MPAKLKVILEIAGKGLRTFDVAESKVRKFTRAVGNGFKKLASLRNLIGVMVVARIGKFFIDAASKIEVFGVQLEVVEGNAKKAAQALSAIRELARTSPLETEDVVQSYVKLRAVGINPTMKQMKTLGGVAVLMNRQLDDIQTAFISLHTRTLRRLGIEIKRTAKEATIRSGNIKKVVTNDSASIRAALLELWEERFPNAMERASATFAAQIRIMKSNAFELGVTLGNKLLPVIQRVTNNMSKSLETMNESGSGLMWTFNMLLRVMMVVELGVKGIILSIQALRMNIYGINLLMASVGEATIRFIKNMIIELYKAVYDFAQSDVVKKLPEFLRKSIKGSADALSELANNMSGVHLKTKLTLNEARGTFEKYRSTVVDGWHGMEKAYESYQKALAITPEKLGGVLPGTGQLGAPTEETPDVAAKKAEAAFNKSWYADVLRRQKEHLKELERVRKDAAKEGAAWREGERKKRTDEIKIELDEELRKVRFQRLMKNELFEASRNFTHAMVDLTGMAMAASTKDIKQQQKIGAATAIIQGQIAAGFAIAKVWQTAKNVYAAIFETIAVGATITAQSISIASKIKGAYARGTINAPGGWGMVGEGGPELRRIPRGTQVFTAGQTQRMVQNQTTNNSDNKQISLIINNPSIVNAMLQALKTGEFDDVLPGLKSKLAMV